MASIVGYNEPPVCVLPGICYQIVLFFMLFSCIWQPYSLICDLQVIGEAIGAYPKEQRINWVRAWPGQTVLCVSQVYWTQHIHEAIATGPQVKPSPTLNPIQTNIITVAETLADITYPDVARSSLFMCYFFVLAVISTTIFPLSRLFSSA